MALHRDIFWIGRQWAVTGHGMQLIDQRLEGAFDIVQARLWDDDLIESLRAKAWLKAEDFEKGLTVARTRYPQSGAVRTTQAPRPEPIAPPLLAAKPEAPKFEERPAAVQSSQPAEPQMLESPPPVTIEPPKQGAPDLQMKTIGGARFARPWRVWMKKT